jgi:hypothetical protein
VKDFCEYEPADVRMFNDDVDIQIDDCAADWPFDAEMLRSSAANARPCQLQITEPVDGAELFVT